MSGSGSLEQMVLNGVFSTRFRLELINLLFSSCTFC
uniref:Uncharacterized protein n=1 Tax=Arundo donax TaxID=35708 RepID=A0A0A9GWR0_ARUDO